MPGIQFSIYPENERLMYRIGSAIATCEILAEKNRSRMFYTGQAQIKSYYASKTMRYCDRAEKLRQCLRREVQKCSSIKDSK